MEDAARTPQKNVREQLYAMPAWTEEAKWALSPFVTSVDAPVYSFRSHLLPPQVMGALFSRASRARGDLREIFWNEYLRPMLYPSSAEAGQSVLQEEVARDYALAAELREMIEFYHRHPRPPYNTERAHQFFAKWLAQYGDESIAQMVSSNLVIAALSQPALKFVEDQRVGIAPIEKSTRYVDYGAKVGGRYMYRVDSHLADWGLEGEYRCVMDELFDAYSNNVPILTEKLQERYPQEKRGVLEKKAFDLLRGFLPMSTCSQVALHGNAQAFKYLIDRCSRHPREELRWLAVAARSALDEEIPALLLRLDDDTTKAYQQELALRRVRVRRIAAEEFSEDDCDGMYAKPCVRLAEYDPDGENKIIAGLLFEQGDSRLSWERILVRVASWSAEQKERVLRAHLEGRQARWEKIGRAFENAFVRFEIIMNAGAYRDLHRHRMHTQERQRFTTHLGYEVFPEMEEFGITELLHKMMYKAHGIFCKIERHDPEVAQDAVTMFHFMRFYQYQNLRQFFWEGELRTTSQGRPDYRWIEQEKYRLLRGVYPLVTKYMLIDMNDYALARRGQEERAQRREEYIMERLNDDGAGTSH